MGQIIVTWNECEFGARRRRAHEDPAAIPSLGGADSAQDDAVCRPDCYIRGIHRSWADGELDFSAAGFHAFEGMGQVGESNFLSDEIMRGNIAAADGFERFADETRGVMERRNYPDFGIVDGRGIDFNARAGRQAAEEIHDTAATDHGEREAPGSGISGGFDNRVGPAAVFRQGFHGANDVGHLRNIYEGGGAQPAGNVQRGVAARERDYANAAARKHAHEFQTDGTATNDGDGVSGAHIHFVNAAKDASERFDKRGALVVDRVRDFEHVFHDDAPGDAHELRVGAVIEEKIFAKILLSAAAIVAPQARSGVGGHHAHAELPARVNAFAHGNDFAYNFVAENGGRLDHLGVIAALPDLEIGAVGEREANAEENLFGSQGGDVNLLNAQIFAAVKDGRGHLRRQNTAGNGDDFADGRFEFLGGGRFH